LSQWSAVIYPATFSLSVLHIASHRLQVSDQSGFGTGGASTSITVLRSSARVVTIPLNPPIPLGISTLTLLVDSLNVNQYGIGGKRLMSMGASLNRSFLIRCGLTVIILSGPSRHVPSLEPSPFTAPSQAALPSPSLMVHFLLTLTPVVLASIGPSMWPLGPLSSSSRTTLEELGPVVKANSLLDFQGTIPVLTAIPLLPLPETPQFPLAPAVEVIRIRLRKRNCKY
jgi:hypothetical protein